MRLNDRRVVLACLFAAAAAGVLGAQAKPARDDAAVREVVRQYVDARARNDAQAVAALFTEDADQLTSSGEWRKGREEVVKGSLASSQRNAGRRTIRVEAVRFVSDDVAIADGRYEIAADGGTTRRMWATFVMRRTGDRWRIAAIRNMLPAAPA